MSRGEFLCGVWPKNKRKGVTLLSVLVITFSMLGLSFGSLAIFMGGYIFLACAGISLATCGLLFAYIARTREFRVYKNGISYPKGLRRLFILYSNISEIKLNTRQEQFIPEIEIHLKDGTTLKYLKTQIHNWREFYRVVREELKDKVKVVE